MSELSATNPTQNHFEKKTFNKKCFNFFDLNEEQIRELKKSIKTCEGEIHIFIHPFFDQYYSYSNKKTIYNLEDDEARIVRIGLNKALSSSEKLPVFVLEEANQMQNSGKWFIDKKSDMLNSVYFVPTFEGGPEPYISNPIGLYINGELAQDYKKKLAERKIFNWQDFAKRLENLGVSRVLISGMNLIVSENDVYHSMCVGAAVAGLKDYFRVKISDFTHPHGRSDISALKKSSFKKYL